MKSTSFFNSSFIISLALLLSRIIPPAVAYRITDLLAGFISSLRKLEIVKAVRLNQWVVYDQKITAKQLDVCVYQVFKCHFRSMYDMYHHIHRQDKIKAKVSFSPQLSELLKLHTNSQSGMLIIIPHLSNFDLAGAALALGGVKFSILSYPQPPSGYRKQNKFRLDVGMEVLPISLSNLKIAGERLKSGKIVITGIDRPMEHSNYVPRFFGHSAMLPVTPVRLALKQQALVSICACISIKKGKYVIHATKPIEMKHFPNLHQELTFNTELILDEIEQLIRQHPEQWAMFYPVWPELTVTLP